MSESCGNCLFRQETGSTDILWCWKKKEHHDVMDPACAWFKEGFKRAVQFTAGSETDIYYCELCDYYRGEPGSCEKLLTPEQCEGTVCNREDKNLSV